MAAIGDFLDKVICGDALRVMRMMPSGFVDLVVTSPPYNLRNSTGNGMKDGRGGLWRNAKLMNGYANHDDNMPYDVYVSWQRDCLWEMMRVLKDDGAIFYNHKWRVQGGLLQDRREILDGFPVRQIIIWQRNGGINFNAGYFLPTYEVVYLIAKQNFRLAPKASGIGDVWHINSERKSHHPAPFPEELVEKIISSTVGQVVLDPFLGSGTTAFVAQKMGRNFIGIDLSIEYCSMAVNRLGGLAWDSQSGSAGVMYADAAG